MLIVSSPFRATAPMHRAIVNSRVSSSISAPSRPSTQKQTTSKAIASGSSGSSVQAMCRSHSSAVSRSSAASSISQSGAASMAANTSARCASGTAMTTMRGSPAPSSQVISGGAASSGRAREQSSQVTSAHAADIPSIRQSASSSVRQHSLVYLRIVSSPTPPGSRSPQTPGYPPADSAAPGRSRPG